MEVATKPMESWFHSQGNGLMTKKGYECHVFIAYMSTSKKYHIPLFDTSNKWSLNLSIEWYLVKIFPSIKTNIKPANSLIIIFLCSMGNFFFLPAVKKKFCFKSSFQRYQNKKSKQSLGGATIFQIFFVVKVDITFF